MYNTQFKVKYNEIKEELTWKLKNKTSEELQNNPDPEYEYTSQDVLDICNKLYRDELASVFYAEDILDDKIDIGVRYILEQMILNSDFKLIIDDFKRSFFMNTIVLQEEEKQYLTQISDFMLILTFFKSEYFHIFHKCICQQLTLGTIEPDLLVQLKKYFTEIFNI